MVSRESSQWPAEHTQAGAQNLSVPSILGVLQGADCIWLILFKQKTSRKRYLLSEWAKSSMDISVLIQKQANVSSWY